MSRLTRIFGAYQGTLDVQVTGYYVAASSGGGFTDGNEEVDGISYKFIRSQNLSGQSHNRRWLGGMNFQAFVDPVYHDTSLQLRYQDLVKVVVIDGGGDVTASIGFFKQNGIFNDIGCFWLRDTDGYWYSVLTDLVRGELPIRTLRKTYSGLDSSDPQLLGIEVDGKTNTIYWLANNEIADFFTPQVAIGGSISTQNWTAKIAVEDDDAKLLMHSIGDGYTVSIGDLDTGDLLVGEITTPVLSVTDYGSTWVDLDGSLYVHNESIPHLASQWEITLDADSTFASPILDVWDCRNLLSLLYTLLSPEIDYRARLRYIGEDGTKSDYSNVVTFTTLAADEDPTTSWSNTGALCQDGETIPSTPWEKSSC